MVKKMNSVTVHVVFFFFFFLLLVLLLLLLLLRLLTALLVLLLGGRGFLSDQCSAPTTSTGQLMGMNEITEKLTLDVKCRNEHAIVQRVTTAANLSRVPCGSDKECRWEKSLLSKHVLLSEPPFNANSALCGVCLLRRTRNHLGTRSLPRSA